MLSQDIFYQWCPKSEFQEISCLRIFDFSKKFDSDPELRVLDIFESDKADQVNSHQGT